MAAIPIDQDQLWEELRPMAERGTTAALLGRIRDIEDDGERISAYRATMRKLTFSPWENKNLDVMVAVADAAIAECEHLAGDYFEQANIISFNTSANLADCWNDDFPRERRHYEKGIEYAEKALWYREHLGKGPGKMAMAVWALGKHQQSLGMIEEARAAFRRCLSLEEEAAAEAGKPCEIVKEAPDGYLIARAYVALIENIPQDLRMLATALDQMEAEGGDVRADAEIIRGQVIETAKQLGITF